MAAIIRVDAVWLAATPQDLRAGMDSLLAQVVKVFGEARPHEAYLFANRRANRVKILVHDGIGVWLAVRRLNQGHFVWPRGGTEPVSLTRGQFDALVLGLPWQQHDRSPDRRDRNFHRKHAISDRIQQFAMRASDADAEQVLRPILDAVDRHRREVHNVIQGFTTSEDSNPNPPHYWLLWNLFAKQVKRATWLAHLDGEHSHGSDVLSTIFLTAWWKDNVRHWRSLEGYAHNVDALFDALPPVWVVLDCYVRFLCHIGERSMPAAFVRVAKALRRGNHADMLRESNTVFMLEALLQRHVYTRPLELKRDPALREAILYVLDVLVESGSSAAFRMRDDFVAA